MKTIVLTGGGSAGHVVPHLALLSGLRRRFDRIYYIGGLTGIEKDIISKQAGIKYFGVTTVKLRRKLTLKNLAIPFKYIKGRKEAEKLLKELKPDVIFSKGGFVAVPVVSAAARLNIPVIAHESDITPGLANKLTAKKCRAVCTTFKSAAELFGEKAVYTGAPIRAELYAGDKQGALAKVKIAGNKPVLLVMGGSLGAKAINAALRENLKAFTQAYDVIHICGKGNTLNGLSTLNLATQAGNEIPGSYIQYEYADNIADLFAAADIVISRAGSGAIHELLALKKPMLLIPLPKAESRGDQLLNAADFQHRGIARVLPQENMTGQSLKEAADKLYLERQILTANMSREKNADGTANILKVITDCAK